VRYQISMLVAVLRVKTAVA